MTAQWMLYGLAVALLLGLGALALERALAAYRLPTRWAWAAALLLSLAVPAAARLLGRGAEPVRTAAPVVRAEAAPSPAGQSPSPAPPPAETPAPAPSRPRISLPSLALPRPDLAALDRPLLLAWGASSAAALLALAGLAGVLERRRRRWRAGRVDGVPVLVSPDTGPAVVGLFRSRIVFPEWAYAAEGEVRALMLEHEREHVRARDPLLLAGALALVALAPWSPALWWQLRRLRLAIEFDCDARVLSRRGDVRAYGTLLLEVGRRAAGRRLALAAFSEPASFLERRIRRMTAPRIRRPWLRAAGFGALAAALGFAACETREPVAPAPVSVERLYAAPDFPTQAAPSDAAVREAVERYFPGVARRDASGPAFLVFQVDREGLVTDHHAASRAGLDSMAAVFRRADRRPGHGMRVSPRDRPWELPQVLSVDLLTARPGVLGAGAVTILWQWTDRIAAAVVERPMHAFLGWGEAPLSGQPVSDSVFQNLILANIPPVARAAGVDGRVRVRFTVGVDGRAKDAVTVGSPHPEVARAGSRVVAGTRFYPELRGGRPVELRGGVMIDFGIYGRQRWGVFPPVYPSFEHPVPLSVLAAAVRRHYPEVGAGRGAPEYWFLADPEGGVVRTGVGGVREGLPTVDRTTLSPLPSKHARVEVGGYHTAVYWMVLKSEAERRAEANRPDSVLVGTLDDARP